MPALSWNVVWMFTTSVAAQLVAISLLPQTRGFTNLLPTIACGAAFLVGIGMVAKMVHSGLPVGILMPLLAAIVPLGGIVIGVLLFGEPTTVARMSLLVFACVLVGAAAAV
jgi:multidrug transporter EmrE-like cation transporter